METKQKLEFRYQEDQELNRIKISAFTNNKYEGEIVLEQNQLANEKPYVVIQSFSPNIAPSIAQVLLTEALMFSWENGNLFALTYTNNQIIKDTGFVKLNDALNGVYGYDLAWDALNNSILI